MGLQVVYIFEQVHNLALMTEELEKQSRSFSFSRRNQGASVIHFAAQTTTQLALQIAVLPTLQTATQAIKQLVTQPREQ